MNYHHRSVAEFAKKSTGDVIDPVAKAVNLYYAVRDSIRYDPYTINLTVEGLKASTTLSVGRAWCIPKAALLAACLRFHNIPAMLGFADVKNHLSTARMRAHMKSDIFNWHGYTSIFLNNKWVKATPAFNIELCDKFHLKPLEFDGQSDSIYHSFDLKGNRHMDYIRFRGEFDDVPINKIIESFKAEFHGNPPFEMEDFDKDVENEITGGIT